MRRYIFLILLLIFGYCMGTDLYAAVTPHHIMFIVWTIYCVLFMTSLAMLFGQPNREQQLAEKVEKLTLLSQTYDKVLVDLITENLSLKQQSTTLDAKITKLLQLLTLAEKATALSLALTPAEMESKGLPTLAELRKRIQQARDKGEL